MYLNKILRCRFCAIAKWRHMHVIQSYVSRVGEIMIVLENGWWRLYFMKAPHLGGSNCGTAVGAVLGYRSQR